MAELDRDELSGPHDAEWLRQERGFVVRNLADFRAGIMPNYSHGDLIADNASMFALMIIARREGGFKKS